MRSPEPELEGAAEDPQLTARRTATLRDQQATPAARLAARGKQLRDLCGASAKKRSATGVAAALAGWAEEGLDVRAILASANTNGKTPLHFAAQFGAGQARAAVEADPSAGRRGVAHAPRAASPPRSHEDGGVDDAGVCRICPRPPGAVKRP
jgi:hypothetical protein